METFECIEKRRTVRKYDDTPVEWEKVGNILRAAQLAPSAGNVQDWRFVVVTDKTKRIALANASLKQSWMAQAPVIIVVYIEPRYSKRFYGLRGEKLYTIQNGAAATENMLIAATDQGLASAWIGAFDENMVNSVTGAPQSARPQALITVGYSSEEVELPKRYKLNDMTYINSWGSKAKEYELAMDDFSDTIKRKITEAKETVAKEAPVLGQGLVEKSKAHFQKIKDKWDSQRTEKEKRKAKELAKEIGDEDEDILDDSEDFE